MPLLVSHRLTHTRIATLPRWRAWLLVACGAIGASPSVSGQAMMCPAGSASSSAAITPVRRTQHTARLPIDLQADNWEAAVNGQISLRGNVIATQGERTVSADGLDFDTQTNAMKATGTVTFDDPQLKLISSDAQLDRVGGAQMDHAQFWLKHNAGHGQADRLTLDPQGNLALDNVRYTSCPPEGVGWELKLTDLDINQATQTGTGRNVRLKFAGLTIFYSPWLSFPVGNQRKSGFLFPVLGSSSRGGTSVAVPWYWNIAANRDDTFTPIIDTARGLRLDNEFRYLGEHAKGKLLTGYLPHDNNTQTWRGHAALLYQHELTQALRLNLQGETVRDDAWFEDFGEGRDQTSLVYLTREARLSWYGDDWVSTLQLQNLQTLDSTVDSHDRPYTRLPTLTLQGDQPLPLGLELQLDSELSYFTRSDINDTTPSITGARAWLAPTLSWPWRGHGLYLTPQIGWRYTGYQLQHVADGQSRSPSISAPVYSLDTGLTLQRLGGSEQQRLYTLEPRLLYNHVPYRDQNPLKDVLFDTTLPNFDQMQLFETNRFTGPDRLGDANQLSAGVTSRMLDARDGTEYLSATLGQVYYFTTPCVIDLKNPVCNSTSKQNSSDVFGQLSLTRYRHLSISLGAQWSPSTKRSDQRNLSLQYRLDGNRVANLVYRYDRGKPDNMGDLQNQVAQWEASAAWPLTHSISGYARVVYSQLDQKFLDHFAGLEYRSCCWNIRAVVGRAITTRAGEYDTQFKLQLELKGLSSLGTADSYLRNAISGFAPEAP